jgi:tetratricopeptide (TPR) repeat protein
MLYKIGANRLTAADHGDYQDNDKVESAIYYFEKAIKKGFVKRELFDKLSYCYLISNNNRNAEKILTIGLSHYSNDAEFYFDRGNCRKDLKNFNGAFLDYDKVMAVDKNFKYLNEAIYYRGAMRYILGDTLKANIDRQEAQKITDHKLRTYADYCQLWK